MKKYTKTPSVFQMEATECGAASLSMIFAYYGKFIPLEQMRIETGVSRDGCNAANIMRAAERHGLKCRAFRKEPDALKALPMPCIIHWNFNHFVVLDGFKGKHVYINDPAVGRRKLTSEEFDDCFTGIVLTFAKTDCFKPQKKESSTRAFLSSRIKGQFWVLFKLFYIGLLLVFPGLVLPILSQLFLDDVLIGGYTDWLTKILVFMALLILMKVGLTFYRSLVLEKFRCKLTMISGMSFLRHLFRLPIAFFDQRYAGDLVSRTDNNTEVNRFVAGDLAETVLNILVAAFYFVIMILYSPIMTLIGLISTTVCIGIVIISNRFLASTSMKMQISSGKLYGTVCAGISITDTIKASGAESAYISRVLGYQAKNALHEQEMGRFQQIVGAIPGIVGQISDALLLLVGGILVISGQLTMGMLVAFNAMYDSFCEPINQLVEFVQKIQTIRSSIRRVEDISKYKQDKSFEKRSTSVMRKKLSGDIALDDVSFGYSTLKPPLVEHFSFHLQSGQSIAFVGSSGCGKSTVAKVVGGLYRPWSGRVLLDDVPFDEIPNEVLNASIASVNQNITLFSGTIRDNLTMWNSAVLETDMIEAARDACIHDFIVRQPGGYDFMLSEGASNLSGGQRQRLEIARALTTKPMILIMDEATSALDPIVEKQILDNIRRRGCTCIVVAHRLSAIRDCNQIVVMKDGQIVQRGSHQSLISEDGYYKALIQSA